MCTMKSNDRDPWKVYETETPATVTSFDQEQNVRLEEELRLEHLRLLKEAFTNHVPLEVGADWDVGSWRRAGRGPSQPVGSMRLEEFQSALGAMLDSNRWTSQMELLFNKVDTSCDGYVDWDEFCTYMLLQYNERDYAGHHKDTFLSTQPLIKHCLYNKQEPTTRILAVPVPQPLRFVSISKEGTLTIWNRNLRILKTQEVSSEPSEAVGGRRRFRNWTTDAVYMTNVHKIAVATTSRDIHFFDLSTANCFEEFHLFGINNVPTCLSYWYDTKSPGSPSLLLWGDDGGDVSLLWFLRPQVGMFETSFTNKEGPQRVFMQDIHGHSRLLSYQRIVGVHQETIRRICYQSHGDLIIASSGSSSSSLVIMDTARKKKSYTWAINKGVTCFDFCKSLNLLVTGGMDHRVRLWNQYVTSRPVAVLEGHYMTVLDVAIYEPLGQIFSYSKDAVLKVWDIVSQRCLRTLVLKFPCVQAGRTLEHGDFPFLLVPTAPHVLLVSCGDYLALLRLVHGGAGEEKLLTHSAPLSCTLYNTFFKQVVTGCDDSTVAVWDVDTGTKCLQLSGVHGQEEITCMAFDSTLRRLVTGARNGTIKVWNLQNGHNLHKLEAAAEAEVTGVVCLQDNKLLTVGWSQQIALYSITDPGSIYVQADLSWKAGQAHKDDILAVDYCPTLGLLATASYDGELILWNLDTQRPQVYLRRAPPTPARSGLLEDLSRIDRPRPNSRHRSSHTRSEGVQPPVDKLLFLQWRAADRQWRNRPLLVSSEAGALCWWSVTGSAQKHGHFYAAQSPDESVLGLCTDQGNKLLVSGDTAGFIQVWDISVFGLQPGEKVTMTPPLLHCWRAHDSTVVSVELLLSSSQLFLVSASSDKTARLWTCEGHFVGTFGQDRKWSLGDPSTYQHPRDPWGQEGEVGTEGEQEEEQTELKQQHVCGPALSSEGMSCAGVAGPSQEGRSDTESENTLRDLELHTDSRQTDTPVLSSCDGPDQILQTKSALGLRVVQGLQRKMAARQERRLLFGGIDAHKLSRIGSVCTPFQVLATPDCQEVQLPSDLPMSPWMLSQGLKCVKEADLKSLLLPSHNVDQEQPEDTARSSIRSRAPLDIPKLLPRTTLPSSVSGRTSATSAE
ncbi:cilia- and flagella-associated protein 337 [Amia ocellicauda]|uniref:cilia- and flagella-associated protein 337 n=1 Tax=Amia ocellicauda TaxID=2972642 RepID=UPI003463960F